MCDCTENIKVEEAYKGKCKDKINKGLCKRFRCRHGEQTIEIDCAPGFPRPDTYIAGVLEGTGLPVKEPSNKAFGCWTWDYSEVPCDTWDEVQLLTKPRIKKLYETGRIRFGSW
jgi:hypothetical protein